LFIKRIKSKMLNNNAVSKDTAFYFKKL
jgi:hypothetical protein